MVLIALFATAHVRLSAVEKLFYLLKYPEFTYIYIYMYTLEPRYNDPRYNDIPDITMSF